MKFWEENETLWRKGNILEKYDVGQGRWEFLSQRVQKFRMICQGGEAWVYSWKPLFYMRLIFGQKRDAVRFWEEVWEGGESFMIRYPQLYKGIVHKGVLINQCDMSLSQLSYESLFLSLDIVFLCGESNDMRS